MSQSRGVEHDITQSTWVRVERDFPVGVIDKERRPRSLVVNCAHAYRWGLALTSLFDGCLRPFLHQQLSRIVSTIMDCPPPGGDTATVSASETVVRRIDHDEDHVVVVGAGIFGAAIAVPLAQQGRSLGIPPRTIPQRT